MSAGHFFPSEDVPIQTPLSIGRDRSDVVVWRTPFGPAGGRSWSEYPIHSLKVALGDHKASEDAPLALNWWDYHTRGAAYPSRLLDPISRIHRLVPAGIGDATQTLFWIPAGQGATIDAVYLDGVWIDPSLYTVVDGTLVPTNQGANAEDGTTGVGKGGDLASGTVASVNYLSWLGRSAFKCTPDGTNDDSSYLGSGLIPCVTGDVLSYGCAMYLTGSDTTIQLAILFYDGAAFDSSDFEVEVTATPGQWNEMQATVTVPAGGGGRTIDQARVWAYKKNQTADPFFVGGFWAAHGNANANGISMLPSYASKALKFATAPGADVRVSISFTGPRVWYGLREAKPLDYSIVDNGAQVLSSFQFTEVIEHA